MLPLRAKVNLGVMAMKGVLRIPQSSCITGASSLDSLESHRTPVGVEVLPLNRDVIGAFCSHPPDEWTEYLLNTITIVK